MVFASVISERVQCFLNEQASSAPMKTHKGNWYGHHRYLLCARCSNSLSLLGRTVTSGACTQEAITHKFPASHNAFVGVGAEETRTVGFTCGNPCDHDRGTPNRVPGRSLDRRDE